jgi:3-oxoacyl-[acyl-carrier-protein] synthase III
VAYLKAFGAYLPARVVPNQEIAALAGCEAEWIREMSGIEERRFAGDGESVADMATAAAQDCLARAGVAAADLGLVIVASGTAERRFPGPAAAVAKRLGLDTVPSLDIPMASAGSLVGLVLADRLAASCGNVLVVGAEKMSSVVTAPPIDRNTAILFGDGAGACLVSAAGGGAEIVECAWHTDGAFSESLRLEFGEGLAMEGRTVILQASRKIPRAITEVLEKGGRTAAEVDVFLMHQANRNLMVRVAQALKVDAGKFYCNIQRYGNTSSASLLVAASEWWNETGFHPGRPVVMAAFGAGFNWGAMLAVGAGA